MIHLKTFALVACLLLLSGSIELCAEKIPVKNSDDLPRITYRVDEVPSEILQDTEKVMELVGILKKDILSILEKYEIEDKSTIKGYLNDLRNIALLENDFDLALQYNAEVREMQEKPADKLTSGLSTDSMILALKEGYEVGSEAFTASFKKDYASKVSTLPWEIVQDNIESSKGGMEMYSANLIIGLLKSRMDPGAEETGQVDFGGVAAIMNYYMMINYLLPAKQGIIDVLSDYIAANRVEKADIWEERYVNLDGTEGLSDVVVAIWDSGVDVAIYEPKNQVWKNENEIPGDGIDNDNNGWVDDVYGIAYDLYSKKTDGVLFDLPEEVHSRYDQLIDMSKGLSDIQASIDSKEATEFKKYMSSLEPEQVEGFLLDLGYFGNYCHGTHVAGIASVGNPAIKLLTARITFDHKVIPDVPSIEESVSSKKAAMETIKYMQAAGVRVVNMSWGGDQASIEQAFEANGVGDDAEMRAEMARILYEISYDGLVEAMSSAPEILFIPAAGNSDEDVDFNKVIPSSISLSNVLVAGAVDQAGDETSFTSYGKNVRVHSNGFEVDSYLPEGKRQKFSGTSMSAPNVTNLAAKLFAIDPSLTPEDVISLIVLGCDTTEDGRRHLMNPKKSISLLLLRNGISI
jgi:subtilisin family serine protease